MTTLTSGAVVSVVLSGRYVTVPDGSAGVSGRSDESGEFCIGVTGLTVPAGKTAE
jgi:hypothetical protein